MKRILIYLSLFVIPGSVFANNLTISQIDTSELFLTQRVKLYLNVSDNSGSPIKNLSRDNIKLYESRAEPRGQKVLIDNNEIEIEPRININNGINFYLMIDNSGSMQKPLSSAKTGKKSLWRINLAKKTVSSFLDTIDNPNDKVGLASFNTNFESFSAPTGNIERVKNYLNDISKPAPRERYTEIYGSLSLAVYDFKKIRGRKVIILLTDGVNQSYYKLTGKPHDVFGKKTFSYKEPTLLCNEEGISVFTVYFGAKGGMKDQHLDEIARETGGMIFSAHNSKELANVYKRIRRQVLNEYLISYPASMFAANKKNVKMVYVEGKNKTETERYYFSGSVLGLPVDEISWLFLLPLILALTLFAGLASIKFENKNKGAYLELLDRGASRVSTKMFSLNNAKTVIGTADSADMTIIGKSKNLKSSQATIVFDNKKNRFTIIGEGATRVNNRNIKTKVLEPGDVIDVCGTTVVFDNNKV